MLASVVHDKLGTRQVETVKDSFSIELPGIDLLLINMCLELVKRHHAKTNSLRYDIEKLQEKLHLG